MMLRLICGVPVLFCFNLLLGNHHLNGINHIQLFNNIVRDTQLKFPEDALKEIHSDCVDLCRSLLRRNPIEPPTFRDFFNHTFLREPRQMPDVEHSDTTASTGPPHNQVVQTV